MGDKAIAVMLGKRPYIEVVDRLRKAHEIGFQLVHERYYTLTYRGVVHHFVEVGILLGSEAPYRTFYGSSEICYDNPRGPADQKAPVENAETSAIGNALINAGIGLTGKFVSSKEHPIVNVQCDVRGWDLRPACQAYLYEGKPYIPVDERIRLAQDSLRLTDGACDSRFDMLPPKILEDGERFVYQVSLRDMNQRIYVGSSEIRLWLPRRTDGGKDGVEVLWPIECAEPSAVGRILGIMHIGIINGIASANEMAAAFVTGIVHDTEPTRGFQKAQLVVSGSGATTVPSILDQF